MANITPKATPSGQTDWKDQLSEIKNNFLPPPPLSFYEWQVFKKQLKSSIEKAALTLEIPPKTLVSQLRTLGIVPKKGQKLSVQHYLPLIKKYRPDFYQQNIMYFTELHLAKINGTTHGLAAPKKQQKPPTLQAKPMQQRYVHVIETKSFEVSWKNVHFEDYAIIIQQGVNYSKSFGFSEARKSFKFLKKYILGLNRDPLKVQMTGNKIDKIENIEQLKDLVTILKVRNEFIDQHQKSSAVSVKSILKIIEPLSVHFLIELAKANADDIRFIDYLTEKQAPEYKPIPVFEIIPTGQTFHSEDTFIFTISQDTVFYLIWESTLPGRATYVFTATANNYVEIVQQIYDYIASVQKAKRMKLRRKDEQASELNCLTHITHSSFEHWKEKIERVIAHQS